MNNAGFLDFLKSVALAPIDILQHAHDWPDTMLGVFMTLFYLFLLGLVAYGIFYLLDTTFVVDQEGYGNIVGRTYSPASTSTTYTMVSNIMIPSTNIIQESWGVIIECDEKTGSFRTSKGYYEQATTGKVVHLRFRTGRISRGLYVREILD